MEQQTVTKKWVRAKLSPEAKAKLKRLRNNRENELGGEKLTLEDFLSELLEQKILSDF